jgi:hypothetical protein
LALRGNVETEIARSSEIGAGCGCAYPVDVDDGVVRRSNEILTQLRTTALQVRGAAARLSALPMHLVAQVGDARIGIVHGDAQALAGWAFAPEVLDDPRQQPRFAEWRKQSNIDVFASTHTCMAALRNFALPDGPPTVINNGSAGMPNFAGSREGLVSRIALTPSPHPATYGSQQGGVFIDALPVRYDADAFQRRFLSRWPASSPAHTSYMRRITEGPRYSPEQARPRPYGHAA